jgi:hypothetical protein
MPGSEHDWTTFTAADLTHPAMMLASLPASDDDVVLIVEPEPEPVHGFRARRRERKNHFRATIWRANGYGEPDIWRVYLTFPEIATKRPFVLPNGAGLTHVGKTGAEIAVPITATAEEMIAFAMDALCRLAVRPEAGVWRAHIPNLGGRPWYERRG